MREFSSIDTRFWIDPGVQALSVETRLTALYVMTGPDTRGPAGFYCPKSRVAEALQFSQSHVEAAYAALAALGLFTFDAQTNGYTVHRFLRQPPRQGCGFLLSSTQKEYSDGKV